MKKPSPKLVKSHKVANLVTADWNPKKAGTDEEIQTLINSIRQDGSAGVLAVRTNERGEDEVIDGNHRLQAIKEMGMVTVPIEHFGPISKALAVLIGHRRNHQWFDDEPFAFGLLLRDHVLEEMDLGDITDFMPETGEELDDLLAAIEFDWDKFNAEHPPTQGSQVDKLVLVVDDEIKKDWAAWLEKVQLDTQDDSPTEAFRLLLMAAQG